MLDNETAPESTPEATAPAPRRRRAAGRPAGAPSPSAPRPEATQPPATSAPAQQAEPAAQATPAADSPAEEAPQADLTPKRRRASTRAAGATTTTRRRRVVDVASGDTVAEAAPQNPVAESASQNPVAEAAPSNRTADTPANASAAAAPTAEEPKKPARRRASRKAAAAEPAPEPAAEPVAQAAIAAPPTAPAVPAIGAPAERAQLAAPEEAPTKPARRRRATRATAAPAAAQEAPAPAAAQEAPAPVEEIPAPAAEPQAAEPEQVEAPQERQPRARRRRATRPSAAPAPAVEGEDDDPIGAALRTAEDLAEARKAVLADPFVTAEARAAQLAALAGAIAADAASDAAEEGADAEAVEEDAEGIEVAVEEEPATSDEAEAEVEDEENDAAEDERPSRRRRRRGGRRRRKGEARDEDSEDAESGEGSQDAESGEEPSPEEHAEHDNAEQDNGEEGGTRRRRRRRRRGESDSHAASDDEVTGIEGSTRMEAKRQRRKESRAAGRRRAPILSEAEFLARRESVDRKLVIRQSEDYTQLAVIEDDILVEHYVDKASATSLIGNIYLGKVQNVLPSMEAAFIDIGRGRNAVLYAGEVDWAAFGVSGEHRKVENVLKSGQSVLVQVTKDPVGAKGARLTAHISLPGRYVVYAPGGHLSGISRKLPDKERARLRNVLGSLISEQESVIVRTAAEGASEEELVRDVNRLKAQWEVIEKKSKQGGAPHALYAEPDLTLRIVRDLFTEDFGHLVVQGNGGQDDAFEAISAYVNHVAPHLAERVERFEVGENGEDLFAQYKIDEQIAKALDRKVYLPSGGSLVIDRTEAMTVIDVNTGRFTGSGGNLEATVTSNNLEAAEEIVRQLRLRDLGGIIVIDFIDMVLPSNRELLLRRLVECLGRDRTRHQVAEVTSLGLVQLTRKKIGTGLAEAFTEPCEHCHGAGYIRFDEPVDSQAPADGGERKGKRRRK